MIAILFALLSLLGWGIGDIYETIVSRKIGGYAATFWVQVYSVILFAFFIPFFWHDLFRYTLPVFLLNVFLGIVSLIALVAFFEGLRIGNASIIGTITGAFSGIVVILSLIFFHERLTLFEVLAVLIILLGVILVTFDKKSFYASKSKQQKGILYALITLFCWGILYTFIKIPSQQVDWFWPYYIISLVFPLMFLFMKYTKQSFQTKKLPQVFPLQIMAVILTSVAMLCYNIGINLGYISVIAPIAGAYPALFFLIAYVVFKDRLNKQQIFGVITTLGGIILLAFLSV